MKNMMRAFTVLAVVSGLVIVSAVPAYAQSKFKKGEKVEITDSDSPGKWIPATVILFDDDGGYGHKGEYSLQADGKPYNYSGWRQQNEIRAAGHGPQESVTEPFIPRFKSHDQVEVVDTDAPGTWIKAMVILVDVDGAYGHLNQYSVQVNGKPYNYNGWRKPNEIRALGENGPVIKDAPTKNEDDHTEPPAPNTDTGPLKVGDRVDVYLIGGQQGKERGTILEINGNRIKVHPDGCAAYWDREQDANLLRPAATISATAPEVKFLVGKWSMTTVGITRTAVAWGKSSGIQINADGSFIWYQDGGRAPVKGKWEPHAKIPNTQFGTEVLDGLVIKDAKGQLWKMTKRISPLDNGDHVSIRLMCSGESEIGTRAK